MKNSIIIIIVIILMASCSSKKPLITNLHYGTEFTKETSKELNYQEEIIIMFQKNYYITSDSKFLKWSESHKLIDPNTGEVVKIWAEDPLVAIKLKDGQGGNIDRVELPDIKATVGKGKIVRHNVRNATDKDLTYNLQKIKINDIEYFYFKLGVSDVSRLHNTQLYEAYIVGLIPVASSQIDISATGNIALIAEDQVYILMPESKTKDEDDFLFGKSAKVIDESSVNVPKDNNKSLNKDYLIVKKGEGLMAVWRRAKKEYPDLTYSGIKKLNPGVNPDNLEVGQKIKIN